MELAAAPSSITTVTLAQPNVEFTPSTLTFGTSTWNTAQTVSVRLGSAPSSTTTVDLSQADWANATSVTESNLNNGVRYVFDVRAVNAIGTGPLRQVYATPVSRPALPTGPSRQRREPERHPDLERLPSARQGRVGRFVGLRVPEA